MKKLRFAFFASVIFALATSMGCNADIGEPEVSQVTNPGENNGTGTNGGENSGNKADVTLDLPVEVSATERGIKFSATILSNIYDGDSKLSAAVMFSIREQESGIEMVRDWKKTPGAWETCDMYYPFVDAGKEYTFYFSASFENHNFYEGELKATATGGLGEFKIENPEECKPVLTNKVIKSSEPKYTDNPNVKSKILRKGIMYTLYADDWTGWVCDGTVFIGDEYFSDIYNGEIDLKKRTSFEQMDIALKGSEYILDTYARIDVAGYTDNGQTYFKMNRNISYGEWEPGSERTKVYVMFPVDGYGFYTKYVNNLPGDPIDLIVPYDSAPITFNCMVKDYNSLIFEPSDIPSFKNLPNIKFKGWKTLNYASSFTNINFPFKAGALCNRIGDEDTVIKTKDGEKIEYATMVCAQFSGKETYNVKISEVDADGNVSNPIDGTISLELYGYDVRIIYGDKSSYGVYFDKDCKDYVCFESFLEGKVKDGSTVYVRADTSPAEGEEVVLFDPETYGGGYAITKIDGESFAEITVDEYNTMIPIPEVDCSKAKSFTTKVCGKEGIYEDFHVLVKIEDRDGARISDFEYSLLDKPVGLATGFAEYKENDPKLSETNITMFIQPIVYKNDPYEAQSGVTVYLGKVVAHF